MTDTDTLYFSSYEDLEVHKLMIQDSPRTEAYKNAILSNRILFEGKVVLEVGAGTGILSIFCAQAKASKVYAVEASKVSEIARKLVDENHFSNIIEVVYSKVEDITLPCQVDIIVSEWMGFYMLHEGMLDSVLVARDKFLKPDGIMFPSHCMLYASPCSLPDLYSDWDNIFGVKMRSFAQSLRGLYLNRPKIMSIKLENILAQDINPMVELDLRHCQTQQLEEIIVKNYLTVIDKNGIYQGVCFWFDVQFLNKDNKLSTSPGAPQTHWKQTIIVLPTQMEVEEGDAVMFNVQFKRSSQNSRHYSINLEMLNAAQESHPNPCCCNQTKCKIIRTFLATTQNVLDDDDELSNYDNDQNE
ncbi:Protein arginine N-methyltransferase,S-adenosyl-L-methionine-dependent methyltransferase [Cinara cedri]|uniref:Protein arginine N-methyltransferase,S-adenosyl-L-methionine-dependent methyltransferase n=1 Tax=Cinara cedri TaxID=506608 RepID=A0A5E4NG14_9HEMI|nr:Protein arginine N-methyltransferase,S-adenosyl-L-methionine-dependent methyltransferase [Cinara cedri]